MNKFNGVFYLTLRRCSVRLLKYVMVFLKNVVNLLLLSGTTLVGESNFCCNIPRMLRIYYNQCEILSMVVKLLCFFGRYHSNR